MKEMRHRITKIRNGCFRLEWEDGQFSDHSTQDGAVKMSVRRFPPEEQCQCETWGGDRGCIECVNKK